MKKAGFPATNVSLFPKAQLDLYPIADCPRPGSIRKNSHRTHNLKRIQMTFSVEMNVPAEEGGTPMAMTADYDMSMTVNATGDSVRITFPDFSNFEEVTVPEVAA